MRSSGSVVRKQVTVRAAMQSLAAPSAASPIVALSTASSSPASFVVAGDSFFHGAIGARVVPAVVSASRRRPSDDRAGSPLVTVHELHASPRRCV